MLKDQPTTHLSFRTQVAKWFCKFNDHPALLPVREREIVTLLAGCTALNSPQTLLVPDHIVTRKIDGAHIDLYGKQVGRNKFKWWKIKIK